MSTVTERAPAEGREASSVVIDGATWADYEAMLRIIGERRVFVNYDQGVMEVMVPSHVHESIGDFLGLMVDILTEELDIPCSAGGSTTHRREDLEKGVEPDKCFWLHAKAASISGQRDLELSIDPAPRLVIEVNYTSSSVDRLAIFAALGVDEIWRFHRGLEFLVLGADGHYQATDGSLNLPMLSLIEASRLLEKSQTTGRVPWMRAFRQHARENLLPARDHHGEDANQTR
jgi:Uma2 family endonuclease